MAEVEALPLERAQAWTLREALVPGIQALRRFWAPFVLIQIAAAALVVAYYQSPAVQAFSDEIGIWKLQFGLLFAAVGGFIAGGIIPEAAKILTGKVRRLDARWAGNMFFAGFVYMFVGVQVDLFYQLQTVMFGGGLDAKTILIKTAVDMGIFAPFLCMPSGVILFEWRSARYRPIGIWRCFRWTWFRNRVIPALLPGWGFWIPFLLCLYALPAPLQLPFALLGEAAWSIIFIFIASQSEE